MTTETPKKKHLFLKIIGGIAAFLIVVSVFSGGGDKETVEAINTADATPTAPNKAATKAPAKPKVVLTAGQENAMDSASNYLDYTAFSRDGLIRQLKFDKYSSADAKFAVDHIKVDWNKQAVKAAEDYLDYTSFSRDGLVRQLKFSGFTTAQAKFGAEGAGL